jgi:hypothetical protein
MKGICKAFGEPATKASKGDEVISRVAKFVRYVALSHVTRVCLPAGMCCMCCMCCMRRHLVLHGGWPSRSMLEAAEKDLCAEEQMQEKKHGRARSATVSIAQGRKGPALPARPTLNMNELGAAMGKRRSRAATMALR